MEYKSSAREFIINEWDWESEELDYINSLTEAQCVQLVSNMKKASLYSQQVFYFHFVHHGVCPAVFST
jgi:hypothetical protein